MYVKRVFQNIRGCQREIVEAETVILEFVEGDEGKYWGGSVGNSEFTQTMKDFWRSPVADLAFQLGFGPGCVCIGCTRQLCVHRLCQVGRFP